MPRHAPDTASYDARTAFVVQLARRLHACGTTTQRLEGAIGAVASRLRLGCEIWSNPTGMILSFSDPARPGQADITRVLRQPPGDTDLSRLVETDRIAEQVMAGELDVANGEAALQALDRPRSASWQAMQVLGFGLASAGIAGLQRLPWLDIATAGTTGLLIALLLLVTSRGPQLREAEEALAGLLAGGIALLVAAYVGALNLNTVIIASLVVLLPGMALTNAMNELASQHLVAGSARFAGAMTTVMKLAIGTMIAVTLARLLGMEPQVRGLRPQPAWVEWGSLLVVAYALAVLFRARRRDYPLVMLAVVGGYLISRQATQAWGMQAGVFLAALAGTMAGNAYARWCNRPGALLRLPGLIVLVPGSASLRGMMDLVQAQDVSAGGSALLGVLNILLALIAGLLLGNLLLPTRRSL